jgi:DNA-binding SARP family transcriptional activator
VSVAQASGARAAESTAQAPHRAPLLSVDLLEGFQVRADSQAVNLPLSAQRVVAFLALRERPCQRVFIAGSLWTDMPEARANASLRTALWRAQRGVARRLIDAQGTRLGLAEGVQVDVRSAAALAERVMTHPSEAPCGAQDAEVLRHSGDLLPDWYDDWVVIARERYRQDRLHALEALCGQLADAHRFGEAIAAGAAAVAAEPLRESAHRALVAAHLAEGNRGEALRQYDVFRRLVRTRLHIDPSDRMLTLIDSA